MTEQEYEDLRVKAKELLALIHAFPAHEMMTYEDEHPRRPGDRIGLRMWSVQCESFE
jgi:hypothetical protein